MSKGIATIHVRKIHGKLGVLGMGKTSTGQKYIKANEEIEAPVMSDPKFKSEMATAVEKLLA